MSTILLIFFPQGFWRSISQYEDDEQSQGKHTKGVFIKMAHITEDKHGLGGVLRINYNPNNPCLTTALDK